MKRGRVAIRSSPTRCRYRSCAGLPRQARPLLPAWPPEPQSSQPPSCQAPQASRSWHAPGCCACHRAPKASIATLDLNAGEWFRRGLLPMLCAPVVSGSILAHRSRRSTLDRVQICAAGSVRDLQRHPTPRDVPVRLLGPGFENRAGPARLTRARTARGSPATARWPRVRPLRSPRRGSPD